MLTSTRSICWSLSDSDFVQAGLKDDDQISQERQQKRSRGQLVVGRATRPPATPTLPYLGLTLAFNTWWVSFYSRGFSPW
jgi:hypothetical protein